MKHYECLVFIKGVGLYMQLSILLCAHSEMLMCFQDQVYN